VHDCGAVYREDRQRTWRLMRQVAVVMVTYMALSNAETCALERRIPRLKGRGERRGAGRRTKA
jgi:hypothetical protein